MILMTVILTLWQQSATGMAWFCGWQQTQEVSLHILVIHWRRLPYLECNASLLAYYVC